MRITALVVLRRPFHQPRRQSRCIERALHLPRQHLLDQVEQRASVPVRHLQQRLARLPGQRQRPLHLLLRALRQPLQIAQRQPLQHQNLRAAQHRRIQLK